MPSYASRRCVFFLTEEEISAVVLAQQTLISPPLHCEQNPVDDPGDIGPDELSC